MNPDTLLYLYGVVPAAAPDPPAELTGVEGAAVRVLREHGVGALVSTVPGADYQEDALNARLDDLQWVGQRGVAHEAVLTWYADRGPVVPSAPFSLHHDEQRLRERVAADGERLGAALDRLRGRREWGIRLWRDEQTVAANLERLSPVLRALDEEMRQAPPGRRFLLGKKREAAHAEELRAASARIAQQVFASLAEAAAQAVRLSVPPQAGQHRGLALHAAFLVPEQDFAAFQRAVDTAAAEHGGYGFELEFTGPWPPYHFAGHDDGSP